MPSVIERCLISWYVVKITLLGEVWTGWRTGVMGRGDLAQQVGGGGWRLDSSTMTPDTSIV